MCAPNRAAFFYPRPVFALPLFNAGFIALQRPALGLLAAETKLMQQAGDVTAVVLNLATLSNDQCHPSGGPQLGGKAVGDRPLHQALDDALALRVVQLRRPPRRRAHLQRLTATISPCIAPTHDGAGRAVGHATDFSQRVTLIQQAQRLAAPRFDHVRRSSWSCHARTPSWDRRALLHYL